MINTYRENRPLGRLTALAVGVIAMLCLTAPSAQALNTYHYGGSVIAPGGRVASPNASWHMVGNVAAFGGSGQSEVCQSVSVHYTYSPLIKSCGLNGAGNALNAEMLYGQGLRGYIENPTGGHRLIHGYWYEDTSAHWSGEKLGAGFERRSRNGKYRLTMQSDGNLVVYNTQTGKACWSSNTFGNPGAYGIMQYDGNYVVYAANGTTPLWNSGTHGHSGWSLGIHMQDDGNLVIRKSLSVFWSSGSNGCY